jgi:hypothetical protein
MEHQMADRIVMELPEDIAEKVRYVFTYPETLIPQVTVVSDTEHSSCTSHDDGTVEVAIREQDYMDPDGFAMIHELGHWYHCAHFREVTEEMTVEAAEVIALFTEMVVFMDPVSPYFTPKWLHRTTAFTTEVLAPALRLFASYKSVVEYEDIDNAHHAVVEMFIEDEAV